MSNSEFSFNPEPLRLSHLQKANEVLKKRLERERAKVELMRKLREENHAMGLELDRLAEEKLRLQDVKWKPETSTYSPTGISYPTRQRA